MNGNKQCLPFVEVKSNQSVNDYLQGKRSEKSYYLKGGNGKFPAYMDNKMIVYSVMDTMDGQDALKGKPFVFGPWVLRVVDSQGLVSIVTRRYRPDLRARYRFKRLMKNIARKVILTWRIWTDRY